jgi:hypothetical protein
MKLLCSPPEPDFDPSREPPASNRRAMPAAASHTFALRTTPRSEQSASASLLCNGPVRFVVPPRSDSPPLVAAGRTHRSRRPRCRRCRRCGCRGRCVAAAAEAGSRLRASSRPLCPVVRFGVKHYSKSGAQLGSHSSTRIASAGPDSQTGWIQ